MSIFFFLSLLSSQHFVSFISIALFPNWSLALVFSFFSFFFFSSLCFRQFCSGRYNFCFPLFTRSIYCTLFLMGCFDFAYGCICIRVYSVTLFIVAINLCLYVELLQLCGVFLFFFLFSSSILFFFSLFQNFYLYFFKRAYYIFSTFIPLFGFPTVLFPLHLIFDVYKSSSSTLFNFACLFFLSFLSSQHVCQFCFHCFISHWAHCFSFGFQFVLQLVLFLTGKYNF